MEVLVGLMREGKVRVVSDQHRIPDTDVTSGIAERTRA